MAKSNFHQVLLPLLMATTAFVAPALPTVLMPTPAAAQAEQEAGLVPYEIAIERIDAHRKTIKELRKPVSSYYDGGQEEMRAAAEKHDLDKFAREHLSNPFFVANDALRFYDRHERLLYDSRLSIMLAKTPVREDDLAYLDRGMAAWLKEEANILPSLNAVVDARAQRARHWGDALRLHRDNGMYIDPDPDVRAALRREYEEHRRLGHAVPVEELERRVRSNADLRLFSALTVDPAERIFVPEPEPAAAPLDFDLVAEDGDFGSSKLKLRMADGSLDDLEIILLPYNLPEDGESQIAARLLQEIDGAGNLRNTMEWPDGTTSTERRWPDGGETMSVATPDRQFDHVVREPDGSFVHDTLERDGTIVTERRDPEGRLIETVRRSPDGWVETTDEFGSRRAHRWDDDGLTVVETDRSGNTLTARFDNDGILVERERNDVVPSEPGRRYFEDELNGDDWNALPQSSKNRYADRERSRENELLRRAREDAALARDARAARERELADARLAAETDAKLAEIVAEQEEADRRVAERQARWDRQREIEEARDKAQALRRDYDDAVSRGDVQEANRIARLHEEHHEASHDILRPKPAEAREIDEAAELRSRLANEVRKRAEGIAEMERADDLALQDAKEATTAWTKYGSMGSQLQQASKNGTRQAYRDMADGRARQQVIDQMLADPAVTDEEREVLRDLRDVAEVREEGASKALMDNARITAAGYGLDAALLGSGVIVNAGRAMGGLAAGVAREAAATELGQFAGNVIARGTTMAAEGGAAALRTAGVELAAENAAKYVAGQASAVGKALTTDISTPVLTRIGSGVDSVARRVAGNESVDAAQAFLRQAGEIATTDVRDLPDKLRHVFQGPAAEQAAARAAAGVAAEGSRVAAADGAVAATPPPAPRNPAQMTPAERQAYNDALAQRQVQGAMFDRRPFPDAGGGMGPAPGAPRASTSFPSREELARLHEPGRILSREELIRKGEAYQAREAARLAYDRAVQAGRPAEEINALAARHRELAAAIKDAQAPLPWARQPIQDASETVIIPRPSPPGTERFGSLPPPVSGPQSSRNLSQLRPDAGSARADWAAVPGAAQAAIRQAMLRTIEQEAAAGNAAAQQLQRELSSGALRIELEPGLNGSRAWTSGGQVALNPLDGTRLKTGEELARGLLANPPANWETGLFPAR